MTFAVRPLHRLLLRAAVAPSPIAAAAWAEWVAAKPINQADVDESTVLPLLASRLHELDPDPAAEQRLRGLRRHAVLRQFVVQEELTDATRLLQAVGIEPIAVKGMALAAAYGSARCRAVGDADVLVPAAQRPLAVATLAANGFQPAYGMAADVGAAWPHRYHAIGLHRPGRPDVDIHWRLPHQPALADRLTDPVRRRARPTEGHPWLLPHPAHQLAIAVAHGWATISQASLRMLVDVAVLLQDPEVTAPIVDEVSGPHRLRAALDRTLAVLAGEGVEGAAELRARLAAARPTDRLVARTLLADRDGAGTRLAWAVAHRNPTALSRPPVQPLELTTGMGPVQPANDAAVELAGHGWWLPDGWATWSRRRCATLRLSTPQAEKAGAMVRLAMPPGTPAGRRWLVVCGGAPFVQVRRPAEGATVDVRLRGGRRAWFLCPSLTVPAASLGTGDRRRLGIAITSITAGTASAGQPVHHQR